MSAAMESGPLATQTATGAGQTKGIIPTTPGVVRDELVQWLARFLDWRLRYEAELHLECASSGRWPDYTEADVHLEMARILIGRLGGWTTMEHVPPEPAPAPKRKPVTFEQAIRMTRPETQIGKAVRLFASRPNQWIPMPEIDRLCGSLNAHSLMANLRRKFGWTMANDLKDAIRGGVKIKKSRYKFVPWWEAATGESDDDDGQSAEG